MATLPKMGCSYEQSAAGLDGRLKGRVPQERRKSYYRCANTHRCGNKGPSCDTIHAARAAALAAGFTERMGKLFCRDCSYRGHTEA